MEEKQERGNRKNNEKVEGWVKGKQENYKKIYNTQVRQESILDIRHLHLLANELGTGRRSKKNTTSLKIQFLSWEQSTHSLKSFLKNMFWFF